MAVTARPDLLGALVVRLRATAEIAALVATTSGWTDGRSEARVSGQIQDKWKMPTHAVWLRRAGGPPGDYLGGIWRQRIDVRCYGSSSREATRLMDIVLPALCPDQSGPVGSFVQAGCRVYTITPEADIFVDREPDTKWWYAWVPVVVTWSGLPA